MEIKKHSDLIEELNEGDFLEFLENYNSDENTFLLKHFLNYLKGYVNKRELKRLLLLSILESHKETDFLRFIYKTKGKYIIKSIIKGD